MTRWTVALAVLGLGVAVAGGYWLTARKQDAAIPDPASGMDHSPASRSPFATAPGKSRLLSGEAARQQRALQYQGFDDVEAVRQLPSEFARKEALYVIAGRSDPEHLRELIAEASTLADENERRGALEILLLRYAEIDPDAALRAALELDRNMASRLIAVLARVAPEKAWESVSAVDDPLAQMEFRISVIESWAAQQPKQAFLTVAALPVDWQRGQLLRQVTAELSRRDPRLAIDLVQSSAKDEEDLLLRVVAVEWSRYDPSGAARWVESLGGIQHSQLAFLVADAYVVQRQEEALAWALRISRSPARNLWCHAVARIAIRNPEEALRLAQSAENPAQRAQATQEVLKSIAARDPILAKSHLRKIPAGEARTRSATQIALQLASRSPATALDWIDELDDRRSRLEVAHELAAELASRDVETAAQLVGRVPKEARPVWIRSVANTYAVGDVDKGVQWVNRYRDEASDIALGFVYSVAAYDPEKALDIVDSVADGKQQDTILAEVIPVISKQMPQVAARTLETIADTQLRTKASGAVAAAWAKHDEAGARKWATSLADGPARDRAFSSLVSATPWSEESLSLIGQIRSPQLRMDVVAAQAALLSYMDPEGMRTLLRRYPLDPQRQQQLDTGQRAWKEASSGWLSDE